MNSGNAIFIPNIVLDVSISLTSRITRGRNQMRLSIDSLASRVQQSVSAVE